MIERSLLKNWFFVAVLVIHGVFAWRKAVQDIKAEQFRFEVRRGLAELMQPKENK
jgi:nicotinamide riboside transporter PnuC